MQETRRAVDTWRPVAAQEDPISLDPQKGTLDGGYDRWQVYCRTTAGEVWPPVGYEATEPIPVAEYLATHPR